jgi:hypothetical protein
VIKDTDLGVGFLVELPANINLRAHGRPSLGIGQPSP